jgi:ribosomal protein S18 acetylase RimI-like enzyme
MQRLARHWSRRDVRSTKRLPNLAHVGPRPERVQLPGVTVEAVTPDTLLDYVLVKLTGFANSEDAPTVEDVDKELTVRRRELASLGRFLIARVGDKPAAILGYYDGSDRLVFNLATRMPFRVRGIARHLLCGVIADSCEQGCRSLVINTDPNDTPIQWYRRLGFTDEVYWRRSYLFEPARNPLLLSR